MNSLRDKTVAVTRAREQAETMAESLRSKGARPVLLPAIAFVPIQDQSQIDKAIQRLSFYDLIIFTSQTAARFFLPRVMELGQGPVLRRLKLASIGSKTTEELRRHGLNVTIEPESPGASEELIDAIVEKIELQRTRILLPKAEESREILVQALSLEGAAIEELPVYRTVASQEGRDQLDDLISKDLPLDWITFASGSQVRSFMGLCGVERTLQWIQRRGVHVAVMGRVTEGVLLEYDVSPTVVAPEPSVEAMMQAMEEYERSLT